MLSVADDVVKELKRLLVETNPRYFWVSLRGNSSGPKQILDSFEKDLDLEIINFDN